MHIMLVYFGIPIVVDVISITFKLEFQSSSIPILLFVILALTLSAGAYASEIIRSGILSVPKGQLEAAYAVGLTFHRRCDAIYYLKHLVNPFLTSQMS